MNTPAPPKSSNIENLSINELTLAFEEEVYRVTNFNVKLHEISEITANLAHELKNPLSIILGYTDLIFELVRGDFDRDIILEKVEKIQSSTKRMVNILDKLIEF